MAEIKLLIGVRAPEEETNKILFLLQHIYKQPESEDSKEFTFGTYSSDFSDSALGALASMSLQFDYTGTDGEAKSHTVPVLSGFSRIVRNEQPAVTVTISPDARALIRLFFEQKKMEDKGSDPSDFLQKRSRKLGLT